MDIPDSFPRLPHRAPDDTWPASITRAHSLLENGFNHARYALRTSENDSHQLRIHSNRIQTRMVPVLQALERPNLAQRLDIQWTWNVTRIFGTLSLCLDEAARAMDEM